MKVTVVVVVVGANRRMKVSLWWKIIHLPSQGTTVTFITLEFK